MMFHERCYIFVSNSDIKKVQIRFQGEYGIISDQHYSIAYGREMNVLQYQSRDCTYWLIGELYSPDNPEMTTNDLFEQLVSGNPDFTEEIDRTYSLYGKWIILKTSDNTVEVYGDPCMTIGVNYAEDRVVLSNFASMTADVADKPDIVSTQGNPEKIQFYNGYYKRTNWEAGNGTFYDGVYALLPNHVLSVYPHEKLHCKTIRYITTKNVESKDGKELIEYCYKRTNTILKGIYRCLDLRGMYAITVTGGKDSRILLAASDSIGSKHARYFTTKTSSMENNHPDIDIPKKISEKLNINISVFNIPEKQNETEKKVSEVFPFVNPMTYSRHNFQQFFNEPVKIIYGLIPEIFSCYYWYRLPRVTGQGLADIARCPKSKYAIEQYDRWLTDINNDITSKGYSVLDLFYWEHRGGRWCSEYSDVTALFQDSYHGFNCRELYDIWLKTPVKIRRGPDRKNLEKIAGSFGEKYIRIDYEKPYTCVGIIREKLERCIPIYYMVRRFEYMIKRNKE